MTTVDSPRAAADADRSADWDRIGASRFDVAIIGGGINGACLYEQLGNAGYRTLLVDRGDFAGGTSQASAMMVWGGLLYLKDLELRTALGLSACRERLILQRPADVAVRTVGYLPIPGGRGPALVRLALYAYWLIGGLRRARPRVEASFPEQSFLRADHARQALVYEEAVTAPSDARFVLGFLTRSRPGQIARNYCSVDGGGFDPQAREFRLELTDVHSGQATEARAAVVVNAAGPATDRVNDCFGIVPPYRHVLSKGISLTVPRPEQHHRHLVFDNGHGGNAMALIPWGPVALWGSTDVVEGDGTTAPPPRRSDVDQLLDQLNRHLARPVDRQDVVALRAGIRPVPVRRGTRIDPHSPSLSRHHRLVVDRARPWISVFGGKLSGCLSLADAVVDAVRRLVPASPAAQDSSTPEPPEPLPTASFPTIAGPVPAVAHAVRHEQCRTLEDYLRRRTNIAQWVRRGGLGEHGEHRAALLDIATTIHGDGERAAADLAEYEQHIEQQCKEML